MTPFLVLLLLVCLQAGAQEASPPAEEGPTIPADEFDRGTPFRSAQGFTTVVDTGDFETAAKYLDLRNLHGAATELTGAQLARRLYVIINRANWVDIDDLIDDPAGPTTGIRSVSFWTMARKSGCSCKRYRVAMA